MTRRLHSSQISSGAAEVLQRVVTPTSDGWWDLDSISLEPNRQDLRSPYLCNGDTRVAVSIDELYRATTYVPLIAPENTNAIGSIGLMRDGSLQVFWRGAGICLFERVENRHLDVLRTVQGSMSHPREREEIGVSFVDTILSLSSYYGCKGDHQRSCPVGGDRVRSLIAANGDVKVALVQKLRDLG